MTLEEAGVSVSLHNRLRGFRTTASIREASAIVLSSGLIAYPTEAVFGLGCAPLDPDPIYRLLALKRRRTSKGLIVIGSRVGHLTPYVALPKRELRALLHERTERPTTWICPARRGLPPWLRAAGGDIAVRLTEHDICTALCEAIGGALVSTSANRAGAPAARSALETRRKLGRHLEYIVPGACGEETRPSRIVHAATRAVLRP